MIHLHFVATVLSSHMGSHSNHKLILRTWIDKEQCRVFRLMGIYISPRMFLKYPNVDAIRTFPLLSSTIFGTWTGLSWKSAHKDWKSTRWWNRLQAGGRCEQSRYQISIGTFSIFQSQIVILICSLWILRKFNIWFFLSYAMISQRWATFWSAYICSALDL